MQDTFPLRSAYLLNVSFIIELQISKVVLTSEQFVRSQTGSTDVTVLYWQDIGPPPPTPPKKISSVMISSNYMEVNRE